MILRQRMSATEPAETVQKSWTAPANQSAFQQ
jgi:hypothetical protein